MTRVALRYCFPGELPHVLWLKKTSWRSRVLNQYYYVVLLVSEIPCWYTVVISFYLVNGNYYSSKTAYLY